MAQCVLRQLFPRISRCIQRRKVATSGSARESTGGGSHSKKANKAPPLTLHAAIRERMQEEVSADSLVSYNRATREIAVKSEPQYLLAARNATLHSSETHWKRKGQGVTCCIVSIAKEEQPSRSIAGANPNVAERCLLRERH